MADTASKSRPALEVTSALRHSVVITRQREELRRTTASAAGTSSPYAVCRYAAAIRHGSRMAPAPLGIGTLQVSRPGKSDQVGHQQLAAPQRVVAAQAEAVEGHPDDRTGVAVVGLSLI